MMGSDRPRLVVPAGTLPADAAGTDILRSAFEVLEVESEAEAARVALASGDALVLYSPGRARSAEGPESPDRPHADDGEEGGMEGVPLRGVATILELIGEGVGVVEADGTLTWANARLRASHEDTVRQFMESCRGALDTLNQVGASTVALSHRPGLRFAFAAGGADYEVLVSIAGVDSEAGHRVTSVAGILWEVTESRRLQRKIDAIDVAGAELMRIEASSVARLDMAQRLALLEEKIITTVREVLHFDKFEIRLIDRETRQLELVFNLGLTPLRIGEVLRAEREDNGISGYVAATGESYLCGDTAHDPLYCEGLEGATSSLTVPLQLHDEVIGVFNVESREKNAFDENDRRFAQIFARYVAMAMHILDLLVVERCTTNERLAQNVLTELSGPIGQITAEASTLRGEASDEAMQAGLDRIMNAAAGIRRRLEACTAGPQSIIGAEQLMDDMEPDPRITGRRIILADNEPAVRNAISAVLERKGCEVTVCAGGTETIELLRQQRADHRTYDLVISDIRMPDHSGYEVFRTAKECCAETPVILITGFGYDPHHSIVRASQEGLHSFLFKPLKASQLIEAVEKALLGEEGTVGSSDG